jgi:hypothetical protein
MSLINPMAIIKKWANGTTATADVVIPPTTTSNIVANQEIGFPPSQEQDPATGGQYVKRAEMNGVFKLYSEHIEFLNKGGTYTFNTDIANAGGYSTGATLWSDYYSRFVTSLKDNNTDNFITDVNKIDGVSWGFTELSDYINISEIPITGDFTTNGTEIVVYCGKLQSPTGGVTNVGVYNVKIKFALKNSGGNGAMYSLSFTGNPRYKFQNAQFLLDKYTTNILLENNYSSAVLEIKTYGGNLGTISEKPSDYIFIVLKVISHPTDWLNPFYLSDVCIEGIGTVLPVIGKTLTEANTILGTNNVSQNQEPKRLYFPSITDTPSNVKIDTSVFDVLTNNFQINNKPIFKTKVVTGNLTGHLTAIKINFNQNASISDLIYLVHFDFVVFSYTNSSIDLETIGIFTNTIDFGQSLGVNESFGSGTVTFSNQLFPALCTVVYSNQNIPQRNKLLWFSTASGGEGRFHITFYANRIQF